MKLCVAIALMICGASALTVEEAKKFHNDGKYGGTVSYTDNGDSITLTSNGLPDHPFEQVNPNTLVTRSDVFTVPKDPQIGDTTGCLSMGPIGMAVTGSMIYDPLNAQGQNAVEGPTKEQFDSYGGHTDPQGIYHYHQIPGSWLYTGEADELLGVAFDGFPIYGPMASDLGRDVTNQDLDECHGRMVNGNYRYHANKEFPYLLGCYKGSTVNKARTTYGTCTNTSGLPQYGYVCTCARDGMHQPMNGQQHNQQIQFPQQQGTDYQHQQQSQFPQQQGTDYQHQQQSQFPQQQGIDYQHQQQSQFPQQQGTDSQHQLYPPMPNQQYPSDRPIVDGSQHSGLPDYPPQHVFPQYPDQPNHYHHMPPPPDGFHMGPHQFGDLFGKKKK